MIQERACVQIILKLASGARVGMDGRGWCDSECGDEREADESGGVDGLGGSGEALVGIGVGGSGDGGVWDRVDDAAN